MRHKICFAWKEDLFLIKKKKKYSLASWEIWTVFSLFFFGFQMEESEVLTQPVWGTSSHGACEARTGMLCTHVRLFPLCPFSSPVFFPLPSEVMALKGLIGPCQISLGERQIAGRAPHHIVSCLN